METYRGEYVDFTERENSLLIELNEEGRKEVSHWPPVNKIEDERGAFLSLIEDHLQRGWEYVHPEDLGALTDAMILAWDVARGDDGEIIDAGRVYSSIRDYQVYGELEPLLTQGRTVWERHN